MSTVKALLAPPDVSALTAAERIAVMREYRLKVTAPKTYDFSLGPPDVSELDGAERLKLLREYRHYKEAQAYAAPPSPVPAGTVKQRTDAPAASPPPPSRPAFLPASSPLDSTYNTHGEPLYGHSTTNGTDVNGTVLPYASEVPASPPYKYPPPADAVSGMPAAGGAAKVNPFTTFERPATAPPPPSVPAVWAPGQAPGTMLPSEAGARSPARPPPPLLPHALARTRLSSPQRPQRVAPPPALASAVHPTSHPPRSLPPHRRAVEALALRDARGALPRQHHARDAP